MTVPEQSIKYGYVFILHHKQVSTYQATKDKGIENITVLGQK